MNTGIEHPATPRGLRLHIGIFGRRNVGKSSLFNRLLHQETAIVSDTPGTTTDPVEKTMEFLPLGPVVFIDTAGVDDVGALGAQRVERTRRVVNRTDLAILVTDGAPGERESDSYESQLLSLFAERKIPVIVAANKCELRENDVGTDADGGETTWDAVGGSADGEMKGDAVPVIAVSARAGTGIERLRQVMIRCVPEEFVTPSSILGDLVREGEIVVLVVPVDKEAPKGRLILPQVQVLRDLLDRHASAIVVQDTELSSVLGRLREPPSLVITDSQAFERVVRAVPEMVRMTSFSVLFARYKGDLAEFARGATAIGRLRSGAKILIGEACTHHPIGDDIGRQKIPAWLRERVGGELDVTIAAGRDYPDDVSGFDLIIHCGACVWNRREMLSRIESARAAGVPITNYGLAIAFCLGILERSMQPFGGMGD